MIAELWMNIINEAFMLTFSCELIMNRKSCFLNVGFIISEHNVLLKAQSVREFF